LEVFFNPFIPFKPKLLSYVWRDREGKGTERCSSRWQETSKCWSRLSLGPMKSMSPPTQRRWISAAHRDTRQPMPRRLKAAKAASPFVHPKLTVTASLDAQGFASQLEE
jgi:hypothetical protein